MKSAIEHVNCLFKDLIQLSIGDNSCSPPNITDDDWKIIYHMAEQQTLTALIFDAIQQLQKEHNPNIDLLMEWYGQTVYIEQENEIVNRNLSELIEFLSCKGVSHILMKGQGLAQYYPNPFHRECGDIDLFVGQEQYERTKHLIQGKGLEIESEGRKDFSFHWNETMVECHRFENYLYAPMLNRRFQKICRSEELEIANPIAIPKNLHCEEKFQVMTFQPTFNAFYVFVHFYHHFLHVGVGLRQIIDWMLLLHHEQNKIEWTRICQYVKDIHVGRAWNAFYWLCVRKLGLERIIAMEDVLGLDENDKVNRDVEFLVKDIFESGNFGVYGESLQQRDYQKGILSNLKSFWALAKRLCRTFKFGGQEVLAYPVYKLCASFGWVKK